MKIGSARIIRGLVATAIACLLGMATANAQQASQPQPGTDQKQPMAEEVFKNVQVLRGVPVNQFMEMMGFFAASSA